LAAAVAGLALPAALPFAAGAAGALACALAVVERTIAARLDALASGRLEAPADPQSGDPVDRLAASLAAALARERLRAEEAEARAATRIAEAQARGPQQAEAARRALVQDIARALKGLADGDLNVRLDAPEIKRDFEAALALYRKTVYAFASSLAALGAGVGDIAESAETLERRARDEGARLAAAREALGQAARGAQAHAAEAREARRAAEGLRVAMQKTLAALDDGAAALDEVAAERARLTEIAERIDGFAFQTQLIALNAGVEAARAGEAGRGIAIVAQELRALSQRSAEATVELSQAVAALAAQASKRAGGLREAARAAEVAAPVPPPVAAAADLFGPVEAALAGAGDLAARDAATGEAVGEASRSLQDLVARLAALAAHFRYPGAETLTASAPRATAAPVADLAAARRRRAL
jgi:methyl-accepting chemotaxis protein